MRHVINSRGRKWVFRAFSALIGKLFFVLFFVYPLFFLHPILHIFIRILLFISRFTLFLIFFSLFQLFSSSSPFFVLLFFSLPTYCLFLTVLSLLYRLSHLLHSHLIVLIFRFLFVPPLLSYFFFSSFLPLLFFHFPFFISLIILLFTIQALLNFIVQVI